MSRSIPIFGYPPSCRLSPLQPHLHQPWISLSPGSSLANRYLAEDPPVEKLMRLGSKMVSLIDAPRTGLNVVCYQMGQQESHRGKRGFPSAPTCPPGYPKEPFRGTLYQQECYIQIGTMQVDHILWAVFILPSSECHSPKKECCSLQARSPSVGYRSDLPGFGLVGLKKPGRILADTEFSGYSDRDLTGCFRSLPLYLP